MAYKRRVGAFISNDYPYYREVMEGISAFSQMQGGWKLAIAVGEEKNTLTHLADHLDGLIVGIQNIDFVADLYKWGKPFVDVFSRFPIGNFPRVQCDARAEGRAGAEHLIGLGFQRFAYCGFQGYSFFQARQQGFVEAVQKMGGTCHIHHVVPGTLDWPSVWKGIADWVAGLPKPIGLMAAKDTLALEVLDACFDLGIKVPDQVAVVGFGNNISMCQQAKPPLSSVDIGVARIGFQAATCLEELMSGTPVPNGTIQLQPVGVACRASTDTLSLADAQMAKVLRHIREHACDPMQINDLLSIVQLSRRRASSCGSFGPAAALHEEIRRIQLQRATRLLTQTYLPLDQVARASGFGSAVWMVKVFRKELGMTPGEHRRRAGSLATGTPS